MFEFVSVKTFDIRLTRSQYKRINKQRNTNRVGSPHQ
jgi:hypothetical protein